MCNNNNNEKMYVYFLAKCYGKAIVTVTAMAREQQYEASKKCHEIRNVIEKHFILFCHL